MKTYKVHGQTVAAAVVLFAAALIFASLSSFANADEGGESYYAGGGYSYEPSYDSTFTPSYDSSYSPSYDSTYSPSYDSTYTPSYDSTYWPSYDSTYTPGYDSTYTPSYDSTYTPSYDSTYAPDYTNTFGSEWEPIDIVTNTYDNYDQYEYTYENGVAYSERSYDSYGAQQSYQPSPQQPFSFRAPQTSYAPSYPSYPQTPAPRPQPQPVYYPQQQQQQQQQQQGGGSQPINIVNTNTNTNINTNTAPVIPVQQAPITYPIQYVYPQQPVYPTYPTQNTYCVITASPTSISNGQASYLTWSSTGATSAWLSDSIGVIAVNGSLAVRPNTSKTYTLTVSGPGGTNTCSTSVTVVGTYVSLSQIPYTGFDAGLLGNTMYWLSLLSFAVAGAYLVVYYKGGALALAASMIGSRQVAMHEAPIQVPVETKVETVVETPIETITPSPIDVMENLPVAPMAKQTIDSMVVMHSKDGTAPRIVITRS